MANEGGNTVSVFVGLGNGKFRPAASYAVAAGPISLAVSDFNGDGHTDLAVAHLNASTVGVLLGDGDGRFQAEVQYNTGNGTVSVASADFNSDGTADLAVVNEASPQHLSILLGNGDGTFPAALPPGADPG